MRINWAVARVASVVYFVQGSLSIASVALPIYLRSQDFSIAKIAILLRIASAPWVIKILYGAISDAIPLWNLRRKPYLIICSLISCVGWMLLAVVPPDVIWLGLAMMVAQTGLAATDVIADGLIVENSIEGTAQTYQGISWGARSVGAIIGGFTGGILAMKLAASHVFMITSTLPLLILLAAVFIHEQPVKKEAVTGNILTPIMQSLRYLRHGDLPWYCLLLIVASIPAAVGTPFFFYLKEELLFREDFLGALSSLAWIGATFGCFLYLAMSKKVSIRQMLYWAIIVGCIDGLLALLIRNEISAIAVTVLSGGLLYIVLLPLLSGGAKLAHATGVEGSLFAIIASVYNLGQICFGILGGLVYESIGLPVLIVISSISVLSGLLIIRRLQTV